MSEQTARWQQLAEDNRRRVEEWLSGGHPRSVHTRGTRLSRGQLRTRSAAQTKVTIDDMLQWLTTDSPQAAWVVVVDGSWNVFADRLCQQVRLRQDDSKFWLVESAKTVPPGEETLTRFDPMRLNIDKPDDARFCQNFVADLVILPSHPADTLQERARRWLTHCYYVVVEGPTDLHPEDLEEGWPTKHYRAPVFVAEDERLRFLA